LGGEKGEHAFLDFLVESTNNFDEFVGLIKGVGLQMKGRGLASLVGKTSTARFCRNFQAMTLSAVC
jgi:hypothetical protein